MKKSFGVELLLDLYHCAPENLNNKEFCFDFLNNAVVALEVYKQAEPVVVQTPVTYVSREDKLIDCSDKAGLSAWVPLVQSGIQLHTLVAKNFISIDFYTCGRFNDNMKDVLVDFSRNAFKAKKIDIQLVYRGKYY